MWHQVRVDQKDVCASTFPCFPYGDLTKETEERQAMVDLFGAQAALHLLSSCATFASYKTAEDGKAYFQSNIVSTVMRNFYVDDH